MKTQTQDNSRQSPIAASPPLARIVATNRWGTGGVSLGRIGIVVWPYAPTTRVYGDLRILWLYPFIRDVQSICGLCDQPTLRNVVYNSPIANTGPNDYCRSFTIRLNTPAQQVHALCVARRLLFSLLVFGTLLTGCSAEIIYTGNDGFIIREPFEPINYIGVPVMSVFAVAVWVITIVCIFGGIENTQNAFRSTEKSFINRLQELSSSLMIVVLLGGVSIFLTVAIRDMLTTYSLSLDGQTRVLRYQKNVFFWTRASYEYPGNSIIAVQAVRGTSNRGILQFDVVKSASRFSVSTSPDTLSRDESENLAFKAKKVLNLPP